MTDVQKMNSTPRALVLEPGGNSRQYSGFKMPRHAISIFIMLSVAAIAFAECRSESLHEQVDPALLSDLMYQVFTDHYDSAYVLCDRVIVAYPQHPSGYFFKAYTMMAQMTEEFDDLYEEEYFSLLDSVESRTNNIIDTCQNDCKAWCCWYLGNIWAYRSLWKARFGSVISAFKLATRARESYETGLMYDSTLHDLYAGLGSVHYWKSAKGGVLRTFGFLADDREKGITELKVAAASSVLSRETARKTLITVLSDFKQYDSAIAYAEEMLASYPNGKSFLWGISWAYYHKENYQRAYGYFLKLRSRLSEKPGNYHKLIECDAQIARCLEKLGQKEQAAEWCTQNVSYLGAVSESVRKKQEENIGYLIRMQHHY